MGRRRKDPPHDPQRDRELALRRENERKDLEVEADHSERPLEGLSGAGTTWTPEQDERRAGQEHGRDEERSREASRAQVPPEGSGGPAKEE